MTDDELKPHLLALEEAIRNGSILDFAAARLRLRQAIDAAVRAEREACESPIFDLLSNARAMSDQWGRQQPGEEEHRKWTLRAVALEDAISAIRNRSNTP